MTALPGFVSDTLYLAPCGALASVGFAILFNAPPGTLRWCAACGALGMGLRTIALALGLGAELATLVAATSVSLFSFWPHKRLLLPTHLFSIPGVINMVPGTYAFRAMTGFMRFADTQDAATFFQACHNFLTMTYILMALALGLVLPSLCLRIDRRSLT